MLLHTNPTIQVPTHRGALTFERFADGEILASIGGSQWVSLADADVKGIAAFLLAGTSPQAASTSGPQVKREAKGWGINVSASKRYLYKTRSQARAGALTDKIGENGRTG